MSNDKLAEALRACMDAMLERGVSTHPDADARVAYTMAEESLQAHAAEAAQAQNSEWVMVPKEPTQAMLDANGDCDFPEGRAWLEKDARTTWAAMLAAAPQPQATEPVRQFRAFHTTDTWTDVKDHEVWAVVTAHPENYETRVLYAHPQPAQDAKDAARYRFLATSDYVDVYAESSSKEDLDRRIDAIMASDAVAQAELAKESGR